MIVDREFKGVWIPREIWLNKDLSVLEKVLFAEIDSLDGENGCYASNEYFMEFFNVSESTITRGISKLKNLGYIESVMIGGRTRVLSVVKMTRVSSQNDYSGSSKSSVSSIKEKIKNNIDNKGTVAGASSKNHSQIYKQKQTLSDDLESGKDIAEQKKAEKKSPKDKFREECLDIIDDEYSEKNYSYAVKDLLVEYFEFVSAVPENKDNLCKRVKTTKAWKHKLVRLDELVKDGYDPIDIIQQSLDKKQYVFYPLQSTQQKSNKHKEGNQGNVVMSDPEYMRKRLAEDDSEEWY